MNNTNKEFTDALSAGFADYGYKISQDKIDKLIKFNSLVMETNKQLNLTAINDGAESAKKHFLDSLNPAALELLKDAESVIDIGSGAGFPGIPLAIINPEVNFTLVDTRKKRCDFIEQAADILCLNNITVIWSRAEELGKEENHREHYDIACARALAAMPTLLEYLSPFVKVGGNVMLYKGSAAQTEIDSARNAIDLLNMSELIISPYTIFDEDTQYAMVYGHKLEPTPIKYPRKSGMPSKRPL